MASKDPVIRFAEIKSEMVLLENELKFLHDEVLKRVRDLAGEDLKPVDVALGTFIIARRKVWEYTPAVAEIEATLKEQKKTEQATGAAKFEVEEQLRFNTKNADI